ncbi:unnamed protein product [marine sediment metagenome]|uniref:Glyceraldehyde 3-phosphate dehydrogenase NAD(P) binding domain-containing protein n=1 Tax=marine sediment metagenome TaxID=412755 RepID=X1MU67_9ZZZZ
MAENDPAKLPWRDLGVDVVVESTGKFRDRKGVSKHIDAGCKKVIITAPAKDPDVTLVPGVNDETYDPASHNIISLASCTTNCLAPVAKVLNDEFGINRGFMTTVHSYTGDQRILDGRHEDLRRARAAAMSLIPTTTGAAAALGLVLPSLAGKMDGIALRVPTFNVSVVDLVAELGSVVTIEEVNRAFEEASKASLRGILAVSHEPLVSIDYIGSNYSAVVDAEYTNVIDGVGGKGSLVKVLIDLNEPHTIALFGIPGSGKSYTLGVITEMAVKAAQNISTLDKPLASVIFHSCLQSKIHYIEHLFWFRTAEDINTRSFYAVDCSFQSFQLTLH